MADSSGLPSHPFHKKHGMDGAHSWLGSEGGRPDRKAEESASPVYPLVRAGFLEQAVTGLSRLDAFQVANQVEDP